MFKAFGTPTSLLPIIVLLIIYSIDYEFWLSKPWKLESLISMTQQMHYYIVMAYSYATVLVIMKLNQRPINIYHKILVQYICQQIYCTVFYVFAHVNTYINI